MLIVLNDYMRAFFFKYNTLSVQQFCNRLEVKITCGNDNDNVIFILKNSGKSKIIINNSNSSLILLNNLELEQIDNHQMEQAKYVMFYY